jgi:hypothetical protein
MIFNDYGQGPSGIVAALLKQIQPVVNMVQPLPTPNVAPIIGQAVATPAPLPMVIYEAPRVSMPAPTPPPPAPSQTMPGATTSFVVPPPGYYTAPVPSPPPPSSASMTLQERLKSLPTYATPTQQAAAITEAQAAWAADTQAIVGATSTTPTVPAPVVVASGKSPLMLYLVAGGLAYWFLFRRKS